MSNTTPVATSAAVPTVGTIYHSVQISHLNCNGELLGKEGSPLRMQVLNQTENLLLRFFKDPNVNTPAANAHLEIEVYRESDVSKVGSTAFVVNHQKGTVMLHMTDQKIREQLAHLVNKYQKGEEHNVFADRTEEGSASQYFQFYGYLSQQQNMMQDYFRTATYQRAILANLEDFHGKTVLDVGAGSGILSFFAAHAGAARVYGIEASSMAKHAESLVYHNRLQNVIKLIPGKVEEVELTEKVDIIISEPMGYMLYNERMLESYLHAKKFLKPGGKMFPTTGDLHVAPFTDSALFMEQMNKANFWYQQSFHGVDLTCLREAAVKEYFLQPVVDTFDVRILLSQSVVHTVNFEKADEIDLHKIEIPLEFVVTQSAELHGLAFWFDVAFIGSHQTVYLSTAPTQPLTHWYQVRCLVDKPIIVTKGQILVGKVSLIANKKQSYDVDIEIGIQGTQMRCKNTLDLKNPFFRYTGQPAQAPPGFNETSPSQDYWNQAAVDINNAVSATDQLLHGGQVMNGHSGPTQMMGGVQMTNGALNPMVHHHHDPKLSMRTQQVANPIQQVPCSIGGGVAPAVIMQSGIPQMTLGDPTTLSASMYQQPAPHQQ